MVTAPTITGTGIIFLNNKYLSYVLIQNSQMIQGPPCPGFDLKNFKIKSLSFMILCSFMVL